MKHTQGLWLRDGNFIRSVDDGGLIAELYISPNKNDGRNESLIANADLIAAAPELLEALELIKDYIGDVPNDVYFKITDVIKKAKGD